MERHGRLMDAGSVRGRFFVVAAVAAGDVRGDADAVDVAAAHRRRLRYFQSQSLSFLKKNWTKKKKRQRLEPSPRLWFPGS